MSGPTCGRKVTGREYYGAHWSPCGRPAKFAATSPAGTDTPLCGIHARMVRGRLSWQVRPIEEASK